MRERIEFVLDHDQGLYSFSELCRRYEISRKTGYKIVQRFRSGGFAALEDQSRAPKSCPQRLPAEICDLLLEARRSHPGWGAGKILQYLERRVEAERWPARSSVTALFKRNGLIVPRRRKPRPGHPGRPLTPMDSPNSVWTVDFKGQFRTADSRYCYPLTVVDGYSRFLLSCKGLLSTTHADVQRVFHRLFREYGLPQVIRSDNGTPFATLAIRRLSRLQVWWIRLGITPELIQPASPYQNGRHERMHRTLKDATARPPRHSLAAQQRAFDRFRLEYNLERPHESLDGATPGSFYSCSPRPYPSKLPPVQYPSHFFVRRVSRNGGIRWKCHKAWGPNQARVSVSYVLAEQYIGMEEVADRIWAVYFGPVLLGRLDERTMRIEGNSRSFNRRHRKLSPMSSD